MQLHVCVFLALSYTFLSSFVEGDSRESTVDFLPAFSEKPAETYYLIKRKPVHIACEAFNAVRITFKCNGEPVALDSQSNYDKFDPETGRTIIRAILEVSRQEVEALGGQEEFWCECFAWSTAEEDAKPKFIQSRRAKVVPAYLNRKFTREPSDQTAKVGSKVEFVCIPPEGGPIPTVIWRKDGRRIHPGPESEFEVTREGSLVIRRAREADQGSYDCVARNAAARRVSRSAKLTLHEPQTLVDGREEEEQASADDARLGLPEEPVFTEEPDTESYVSEGKPVKVFCRVVGADILTFNCNDRRVSRARTTVTETQDPGSGVRIIEGSYDVTPDVVKENNDEYNCNCVAWYTRPSFKGWRTVKSRRAVTRTASLEEDFVLEPMSELVGMGDRLDLYCTPPIGSPEAKIRWVKDGNPVTTSDRNFAVDASGTLTIRSVRRQDAGSYVCIATNPANTRRSSPAVITVSDQPVSRRTTPPTTRRTTTPAPTDAPVFLQEPESTYYVFDKPVSVSTVVRGAEMLEVRCLARRLSSNEAKTETKVDPVTNKRELTTTFTVTPREVQGESRPYTCTLHAWYVRPGERNWSLLDGASVTFVLGKVGSEFVEEPKEQMVAAGGTATFRCSPPSGVPPFTVKWTRESQVLQPSDRLTITEDMLTISDVSQSDGGLYTCMAEHEASGTVLSRSAMLAVTSGDSTMMPGMTTTSMTDEMTDGGMMATTTAMMMPETTTPGAGEPFFTLQPHKHYYLIRDSPAVVTVAARNVQIISFECNGMRVAMGEGPTRTASDPDTGAEVLEKMLTVSEREFSKHRGDDYSCLSRVYYTDPATGNLDNITSEVFHVAKAYLRKSFVEAPISGVEPLNSRVELRCRPPKGVPAPSVSWYKDNEVLDVASSDHLTVTEAGSLVIAAMRQEDAGTYVCVAENIFARRTSSPAQLSFIDAVDMTTPMPSAESTPDEEEQSGTVMYDSPPVFVSQSPDYVFAAPDTPAQVQCEATNTMKITFTCNAQQMDEGRVTSMDGTDEGTGNKTLVAKLMIKQQEVLDAENPDDFWCQCYAHYNVPGLSDPQYELGKRVYVRLAYLDEFDSTERKEMVMAEGKTVSVPCTSPDGSPAPELSWMRNGEVLDVKSDANLQWPVRGQLVIISLGKEDVGVYKCVAKNSVGEKYSGEFVIRIDGMGMGHSDSSSPEPEATAEPEGMGTTVALANATVVIDEFDFVTMDGEEDGELMATTMESSQPTAEPTPYPEGHTTDSSMVEKPKGDCKIRITECGVGLTPEQICQSLSEYQACVDSFIEDCRDSIRPETIELALMARDSLVEGCQKGSPTPEGGNEIDNPDGMGPVKGGNCPELEACRESYKESDMNYACSGLEAFLRCLDNAIVSCSLDVMQNSDSSLSDLADWFQMYCSKVVVGEGSMLNCDGYRSCQIPVDTSLATETLYTVEYWCPHVHSTMACTKEAATDCPSGNTIERQNVFYELDQNALAMCPKPMTEEPAIPPVIGEPASSENRESGAHGLAATLVMTLAQLVITVVFIYR